MPDFRTCDRETPYGGFTVIPAADKPSSTIFNAGGNINGLITSIRTINTTEDEAAYSLSI